MRPAAEELKTEMEIIEFWEPEHPIIMNCCAGAVSDAKEIRRNLIKQLTNPVRMEASIYWLLEDGFDCFLELGPGKTLSGFVRKCAKAKGFSVKTYSANDAASLEKAINQINGGAYNVE